MRGYVVVRLTERTISFIAVNFVAEEDLLVRLQLHEDLRWYHIVDFSISSCLLLSFFLIHTASFIRALLESLSINAKFSTPPTPLCPAQVIVAPIRRLISVLAAVPEFNILSTITAVATESAWSSAGRTELPNILATFQSRAMCVWVYLEYESFPVCLHSFFGFFLEALAFRPAMPDLLTVGAGRLGAFAAKSVKRGNMVDPGLIARWVAAVGSVYESNLLLCSQ